MFLQPIDQRARGSIEKADRIAVLIHLGILVEVQSDSEVDDRRDLERQDLLKKPEKRGQLVPGAGLHLEEVRPSRILGRIRCAFVTKWSVKAHLTCLATASAHFKYTKQPAPLRRISRSSSRFPRESGWNQGMTILGMNRTPVHNTRNSRQSLVG